MQRKNISTLNINKKVTERKAIQYNKRYTAARMNLGIILTEKLGDFDEAISDAVLWTGEKVAEFTMSAGDFLSEFGSKNNNMNSQNSGPYISASNNKNTQSTFNSYNLYSSSYGWSQ